jgi:hypothetical protein
MCLVPEGVRIFVPAEFRFLLYINQHLPLFLYNLSFAPNMSIILLFRSQDLSIIVIARYWLTLISLIPSKGFQFYLQALQIVELSFCFKLSFILWMT